MFEKYSFEYLKAFCHDFGTIYSLVGYYVEKIENMLILTFQCKIKDVLKCFILMTF